MKKYILILFLTFTSFFVLAQKRGNIWTFGHGAAIDFNGVVPVNDSSALLSRGSCASICDTNGQLLFYSGYDDDIYSILGPPFQNGEIYNSQHNTMQNGDSIVMAAWYYETVIIPFPGSDSLYYVFSTNVTGNSIKGLFYSTVDMNLNGGLGEVIQKNVLLQNFKTVDCLTAIKHGNGRDWWIVFRKSDFPSSSNSDYYRYLITANGIENVSIQSIGSQNSTNKGNIEFNALGSQMIYTNLAGLMDKFDFDRCTGLLTNHQNVFQEQSFSFTRRFWDGQFSPSGNYFFITASNNSFDTSKLIQYDLQASNVPASADTLWQTNNITNQFGQIKLAPDNKIYLTTWYNNGMQTNFPYADTMTNVFNSYLSVVNEPDSLGAACDFQPYSFYLGGKRTYLGLPNNPDYDLPALAGSPCDTLVSQNELAGIAAVGSLHVYYHPAWGKAFINASNLKGKTGKLLVYDMQGKVVHSEPLRIQNGFYTRDLSMMGKADGVYLVVVETEQERLVKKVMVE